MDWSLSLKEAKEFQLKSSKELILKTVNESFRLICGVDAAFSNDKVYAVACSFYANVDFMECKNSVFAYKVRDFALQIIEETEEVRDINYPYVPGFFAWREGPALIEAIKKLKTKPDVILVDGQGIAHPRGFGIASHIGLLLKIPTIGCAKTRLIGTYKEPGIKRGSWSNLFFNKKIVGAVVRTKTEVKPVFVSPGNLIDLETSIRTVLSVSKYRLPEPLRIANIKSKKLKINAKFQNPNVKNISTQILTDKKGFTKKIKSVYICVLF